MVRFERGLCPRNRILRGGFGRGKKPPSEFIRPMAGPLTHRQKEVRRHVLIYGALTPYVVIALFPIYWMALTALKQDQDLYRMDQFPLWFHLPPTLKNFSYLFYSTNYGAWIVNTMSIAAWVAVITLLVAVPAGYALARLRIPGSENL